MIIREFKLMQVICKTCGKEMAKIGHNEYSCFKCFTQVRINVD